MALAGFLIDWKAVKGFLVEQKLHLCFCIFKNLFLEH